MRRRLLATTALAAALLVGTAAPAWAHVEIDPAQGVAGTTMALTFVVEHGVDEAPTTEVVVRLPEGASVPGTPTAAGWTVTVDEAERTVTWSGGSAPAHEELVLPPIDIALPDTPGEVLFPTIERSADGELAWIEEEESDGEGALPAPRMTLTANPNATTTSSTTDTTVGSSTTNDLPDTSLEAEEVDDGDESPAPWLIGAGIAALVAIGVGGYLLKRRSDG